MNREVKKGPLLRRLIVKFGTTNLCNENGQLDQGIFDDFAQQVVKLQSKGIEVVIVSSGGIKAGRERAKSLGLKNSHLDKKELAGIGARHLLNRWGNAFEIYEKEVSQVWVTYANWSNKGEKESIKSSILNFLNAKVVTIVNELDVVSDLEIKSMEEGISENDRLAKMIAFLVDADAVLFLTDEGGIYEQDPQINPRAKLHKEISAWTKPELIGFSSNTSKYGTSGMRAKFEEAAQCAKKGMRVTIAGREKNVILKFARGEHIGTKITSSDLQSDLQN